jgi:hypothetical protein
MHDMLRSKLCRGFRPRNRFAMISPFRDALAKWTVMDESPCIGRLRRRRHADDVRRDCCGRTLRGFADRDAPRSEGIPCAGGRPRDIPERYRILARPAPDGRRRPGAMGPGSWLAATGCPPIHTYTFDFGPFTLSDRRALSTHRSRIASGERCSINCSSTPRLKLAREMREGFTVEEP